MNLTCPCCQTDFTIESGYAEGDGKRLAALLAGVEPELGRALVSYLRLHKPAKTALRLARAVKLAGEVVELVRAGTIRRGHGAPRRASAALWVQGIETLIDRRDKLRLPLSGHGLLAEIVYGFAEKAEAAAEREREERTRRGHRPGSTSTSTTPIREQLSRLRGDRDLGLIDEDEYQRRAELLRADG